MTMRRPVVLANDLDGPVFVQNLAILAWLQAVDAGEERFIPIIDNAVDEEVAHDPVVRRQTMLRRDDEQALDLRGEGKAAAVSIPIQRLLADPVARQPQPAGPAA